VQKKPGPTPIFGLQMANPVKKSWHRPYMYVMFLDYCLTVPIFLVLFVNCTSSIGHYTVVGYVVITKFV